MNRTTAATFSADRLKGLLLLVVIGIPTGVMVLGYFTFFGRWAWLYAWLALSALQLVMALAAPAVILPMFYTMTPLEDGALKSALDSYAARVGFKYAGISVVDGSRRSAHSNAFFTGLPCGVKSICLFDTLVEKASPEELTSIVAHEVGHEKLGHVSKSMVVSLVYSFVLFFLMQLFLTWRPLYAAFGVSRPSVYVGLLLFQFVFAPVDTFLELLLTAQSRRCAAPPTPPVLSSPRTCALLHTPSRHAPQARVRGGRLLCGHQRPARGLDRRAQVRLAGGSSPAGSHHPTSTRAPCTSSCPRHRHAPALQEALGRKSGQPDAAPSPRHAQLHSPADAGQDLGHQGGRGAREGERKGGAGPDRCDGMMLDGGDRSASASRPPTFSLRTRIFCPPPPRRYKNAVLSTVLCARARNRRRQHRSLSPRSDPPRPTHLSPLVARHPPLALKSSFASGTLSHSLPRRCPRHRRRRAAANRRHRRARSAASPRASTRRRPPGRSGT